VGLGRWRLDGLHVVSARKEEAEELHETLSPGAWHQHHGGIAALTAVDWRSGAMQCLGGNAACQRFADEAAGKVMRWQLIEAWMEHHGAGRVQNFTGGQCGEEQTQAGNGDGTPPRTAVDATAKGGRWTRGHSCGVEW
jgi:TRAP-type mannitol/chloroaromatic compound transport system substrate-binding protein